MFSGSSFTSFDPTLDGRKEIAKYNQFMDEIFTRMNIAIKAKNLDPMDLKLLPNADKMPRLQQSTFYGVTNVSAEYILGTFIDVSSSAQWARKFKKGQAKKLVKSNKSIS